MNIVKTLLVATAFLSILSCKTSTSSPQEKTPSEIQTSPEISGSQTGISTKPTGNPLEQLPNPDDFAFPPNSKVVDIFSVSNSENPSKELVLSKKEAPSQQNSEQDPDNSYFAVAAVLGSTALVVGGIVLLPKLARRSVGAESENLKTKTQRISMK